MTRPDILDLLTAKHKFDILIPEYLFCLKDSEAKIVPLLSFLHMGKTAYVSRINTCIANKHNTDIVVGDNLPTSSGDYVTSLSRGELFAFFENCPQEVIDSVKIL